MKLYLVNNEHYIVCYDFSEAERLYRERFTDYSDTAVKSIEMISDYVILRDDKE